MRSINLGYSEIRYHTRLCKNRNDKIVWQDAVIHFILRNVYAIIKLFIIKKPFIKDVSLKMTSFIAAQRKAK